MSSLVLNISTPSIINLFQCLNYSKVKNCMCFYLCSSLFVLSYWKESDSLVLIPTHQIFMYIRITSGFSSQAEQFQLLQSLLTTKMFQLLTCICDFVLGSFRVLKLMWRREKTLDTCLDKHCYNGKKIIQAIWYRWATQKPTTSNQCVETSFCLRRKEVMESPLLEVFSK